VVGHVQKDVIYGHFPQVPKIPVDRPRGGNAAIAPLPGTQVICDHPGHGFCLTVAETQPREYLPRYLSANVGVAEEPHPSAGFKGLGGGFCHIMEQRGEFEQGLPRKITDLSLKIPFQSWMPRAGLCASFQISPLWHCQPTWDTPFYQRLNRGHRLDLVAEHVPMVFFGLQDAFAFSKLREQHIQQTEAI